MAGKYVIGAAQFEDVESGMIDLNKIVSGLKPEYYDSDKNFRETATQIQILNENDGYDTYYYLIDAWDEEIDDCKEGWSDAYGNYVEVKLTAGTAFWIKTVKEDTEQVISGAVAGDSDVVVGISAKSYKLIANAFPMPLLLNGSNMTTEGIVPGSYDKDKNFHTTSPQIQVLNDSNGYDTYYYLKDGYVEADGSEKEGWSDAYGNLVDVTIPTGCGFWIKGVSGDFRLTFTK